MRHIGPVPPDSFYKHGIEIDFQCARCGSSIESEHCDQCEDGFCDHDCGEDCCCCAEPELNVPCEYCDGTGVWRRCISLPEWCEANPLPGRENVQRGQIEWLTINEQEVEP